jgi:putative restriction endonuclease
MANPSYDETYRHILSFMSDGNICTKKMIKDELISHFEMTDSEINEISQGGDNTTLRSKYDWGVKYFRLAKLVESVSSGEYKITPRGKSVVENELEKLNLDFLNQYEGVRDFLNKTQSQIGEIDGVIEGQNFENRRDLHDANVHRGLMRGIGARGESIVLSGGYVDDKDYGDEIIYTGEGGRDPNTGLQVSDQTLTGGNLALYNHYREGRPIRVSRGSNADSPHAPPTGYRYGGLYRIESVWSDIGRDGYKIWRYKFIKLSNSEIITPTITSVPPQGSRITQRIQVTTSRVIRSSAIGNYVKDLYDYTCQISGVQLDTPNGPYAEACHIQPVGKPHNGPDEVSNVLCLSPNMHVLFDLGAISINDDLTLKGIEGRLTIKDEHDLSKEAIKYHREHIFKE